MSTPHVFVSHSHEDDAFCSRLVHSLRQTGADVWFDDSSEGVRNDLGTASQRALKACSFVVLVLSPAAVESESVTQELREALQPGDRSQRKTLIPVLYRPCAVPEPLARARTFSFLPYRNYDDAIAELVTELRYALKSTEPRIRVRGNEASPPAAKNGRLVKLLSTEPAEELVEELSPGVRSGLRRLVLSGKASDVPGQLIPALWEADGEIVPASSGLGTDQMGDYEAIFEDSHTVSTQYLHSQSRHTSSVTDRVRRPFDEIKRKVQSALINELNPTAESSDPDKVERALEEQFNRVLSEQGHTLSRNDRQQLLAEIKAEILGYGPIDLLLHDDSVTEVIVNGPQQVYVEQNGRLYATDIKFRDDEHVMHIIERIISPLGRRCDEASPYVDARLPDGSRVNVVIPPISLVGPVLTIRKLAKTPLQPDDLVKLGTLTPGMVEFLRACVQVKLNIVVSGGTGSGKTTLLNILSGFIPDGEHIITIEDAAELQLSQTHVLRLESRPANIEGKGRISIRDLVANALRMRPDRMIVGECRRDEALDMLQAMNTGHEGSMTTIHSNSPRDTLRRLETLVTMGELQIPLKAIREQISSAIHLIVHQERMIDGSRKITSITEVLGMEGGEVINSQQLFVFEQTGLESGRVVGRLSPTGARPSFIDRFELANIHLHPSILGAGGHR